MEIKIVPPGSESLYVISKPIEDVTEEIIDMAQSMSDLVLLMNGAGLAAPQIGESIRMFVFRSIKTDSIEVAINPTIIKESGYQMFTEACFSLPGVLANVVRSKNIKVSYTNKNNKRITKSMEGLQSTIFLHEYDHLDGILFIDKAQPGSVKVINDKMIPTVDKEGNNDG